MDESALRTQLNNLETARSSLHGWMHFWEWVVLIGITLEFVVLVVEYCDERHEFLLSLIRFPEKPEKPRSLLYAVAFLGVAMVAGGITKQLGIDSRIEHIETQIRAIDEQLFGMVSKEAERAASASETAKSDAKIAHEEADSATKAADKAQGSAEKAQREADGAGLVANRAQEKAEVVSNQTTELAQGLTKDEKTLTGLEAKRDELETSIKNLAVCTAPRVVLFETKYDVGKITTESDSLKAFAEYKAEIEFVPDPEARRAALYIEKALKRAGWGIVVPVTVKDGIPDGVVVQPFWPSRDESSLANARMRSREAAEAIIKFLRSYNWQADMAPPLDEKGRLVYDPKTSPSDILRIRVGLYPATMFVAPPALKSLADAEQERRRQQQEMRTKMEEEYLKNRTPQQILEFKARRKEYDEETKRINEESSNPCKPLTPLFSSP